MNPIFLPLYSPTVFSFVENNDKSINLPLVLWSTTFSSDSIFTDCRAMFDEKLANTKDDAIQ